jgi:GrpB-like predicted nucleotidyltransferase (UPF0157 family)
MTNDPRRELEALVKAWDPIGLIALGAPVDEYACIVGPTLSLLQRHASYAEIARYLLTEFRDHFGVTIADPAPFVERAVAWFRSRRPVVIVDYDEQWPQLFEQLRDRAWREVSDIALSIEHVGSTSVPGLAAKPIIDLDIVVPTPAALAEAIARLASLGYRYAGDLGIEHRHGFHEPPEDPPHNLYVCLAGSRALRNHLALRDHLRLHPEVAAAYATLKRRLAAACRDDRPAYSAAKTDFILGILEAQGIPASDRAAIRAENQPPTVPAARLVRP